MIAAVLIVDLHEKLVLFAFITLHTYVGRFSLFQRKALVGLDLGTTFELPVVFKKIQ
jgi:hypothetical protein